MKSCKIIKTDYILLNIHRITLSFSLSLSLNLILQLQQTSDPGVHQHRKSDGAARQHASPYSGGDVFILLYTYIYR